MNTEPQQQDQDLLALAERALQELAIPTCPSTEIQTQTLAAMRDEADREERSTELQRSHSSRRRFLSIAGMTTVVAAMILVIAGVALFNPRESLAFEDLAKPFREAKTLVYDTLMVPVEGPGTLEVKSKQYFKEPGLSRRELGDGSYVVHDANQAVMLFVYTNTKTATVSQQPKLRDGQASTDQTMMPANWLKSATANGDPVEPKEINGILAQGFRSQFGAVTMTLWGDPKTKQPLLIEMPLTVGETTYVMQMFDFQFDLPLDDSLFSIEPPAGYQVQHQTAPEIDFSLVGKLSPEEHVVRMLKYYSGLFAGSFPKQIDDPALTSAITTQLAKDGELTDDERQQLFDTSPSMGAIWTYRQSLPGFGYHGDVKLGERERLVFWYRPKGRKLYRAVYGDLRIEDVPADQIPQSDD